MRVWVKLQKAGRIFLVAVISAATVAGICAIDANRQHANQTALSLRWARQMVTQTESLALAADSRGEPDPLTWAARLLSQGTDSRIIFASKVSVPIPVTAPESYSLDPASGIFDYTKIFDMEAGTGIRIRLYTTRTGLFGAKTRFQHDLTVALLFLALYGLLYYWIIWSRRRSPEASIPATPYAVSSEASALKPVIAEWALEANQSLKDLGIHIREIIRAANELSKNSRESKQHVRALKAKLHGRIEIIHSELRDSSSAGELTRLASEVEGTLTSKKSLDPETRKLLKNLLEISLKYAGALSKAEIELEPMAVDADLAWNSLEAAQGFASAISKEIAATTEGILQQSTKIGELKKRGA